MLLFFGIFSCEKNTIETSIEPTTSQDTSQSIDTIKINPLQIEINKINPTTYLAKDGAINLTISGGKKPYNVSWIKDNPWALNIISEQENLSELESGIYYLTLIDSDNNIIKNTISLVSLDTIYPKEYLPVYPGSFWVYNNGDTLKVENEYTKTPIFKYLRYPSPWDDEYTHTYYPTDSIYVPIWNGTPILEYRRINYSESSEPLIPIVSLNKNDYFTINRDARWGLDLIGACTIDTSITINNTTYKNVIVTLSGHNWGYNDSSIDNISTRMFYAKDIGLIRVDKSPTSDCDTLITILEIDHWKINN